MLKCGRGEKQKPRAVSIRPATPLPTLKYSVFQRNNVIKPSPLPPCSSQPIQTVLINLDCNTSSGLIRDGLFTCWDFVFVFYLQLHDRQVHVPEIFHFFHFFRSCSLWRIQTIFRLSVVIVVVVFFTSCFLFQNRRQGTITLICFFFFASGNAFC